MKLFYAVVGKNRVSGVEIGIDRTVGDLQEAIKCKAEFGFQTDMLDLYLAKENGNKDGTWLGTYPAHPDYSLLLHGDEVVEATYLTSGLRLDPTWLLERHFTGAPKTDAIHVLVKLPDDRSTTINVPVRTSKKDGEQSSFVVGPSSWWGFSYLSQLLSTTASEAKKNL